MSDKEKLIDVPGVKEVCKVCWYYTRDTKAQHGKYRCAIKGSCPAFDKHGDMG